MSTISATRPTTSKSASFRAADPREWRFVLRIGSILLLLASFFATDTIAYVSIVIPVLVPAFLWVNAGAFGIPVLPTISALYYIYYAVPLLTSNTLTVYTSFELVSAATSVGLFLLSASLAAWPLCGVALGRTPLGSNWGRVGHYVQSVKVRSITNLASSNGMVRLIFIGLAVGILYNAALISGRLDFLGSSIGIVRALALPSASIACYLMGFARGTRLLAGQRWLLALCSFLAVIALAVAGLFLFGALMNMAAFVLGYVLATRRIPWLGIGFALAVATVLNAGKHSMRNEYWAYHSQSMQNSSVLDLPNLIANWFVAGIGEITSPSANYTNLLERASLLQMVITVQQSTPRSIPYLEGGTYALLPAMLIPRVLEPNKIESQAGLNLLSVRYGLETVEETARTTIAWGLVSEAYANLGNYAVIAVGVVFGILCGLLMRLSATAAPVSLGMLIAIGSTLTLFNVEADFSFLIVTLFQTVAGILMFGMLPRVTGGAVFTIESTPMHLR